MKKSNKCLYIISTFLIASCLFVSSANAAGTLSASTSLTIVNVTRFLWKSVDTTQWGGDWPTSMDARLTSEGEPDPDGSEVYLHDIHITPSHLSWDTTPNRTPYYRVQPRSHDINAMIVVVWSDDKGKTFNFGAWDYITPYAKSKHLESGMHDCWTGTMINSLCERRDDECNGRYRTNLIFAEYPAGNTDCWGLIEGLGPEH